MNKRTPPWAPAFAGVTFCGWGTLHNLSLKWRGAPWRDRESHEVARNALARQDRTGPSDLAVTHEAALSE